MALKSTIFRIHLSLADVDRGLYQDFPLTVARHPSETDARLMLRVLAFALHADERLEFGRGISTADEPDLWRRSLDGRIEQWIELGTPEPERLRKACGRAEAVQVYAYGDRAVPVWWRRHGDALGRLERLRVLQFADAELRSLAAMLSPGLQLQCTLNEGNALLVGGGEVLEVAPAVLQAQAS
jgi:uncharacterized protein YaeQ